MRLRKEIYGHVLDRNVTPRVKSSKRVYKSAAWLWLCIVKELSWIYCKVKSANLMYCSRRQQFVENVFGNSKRRSLQVYTGVA